MNIKETSEKINNWANKQKIPQVYRKMFIFIFGFFTFITMLDYAFHSYGIDYTHSLKAKMLRSAMERVLSPSSESSFIRDLRKKAQREIDDAMDSTSFSVVLNAYKRPKQLRKGVQYYAESCGKKFGVNNIYIIWAEVGVPPPDPTSFFDSKDGSINRASVQIIQTTETSLNTRFEPIHELEQHGLFLVDDDIQVACTSLQRGFEAWKTSPLSLVGFYPRLIERRGNGQYSYRTWPMVYLKNTFHFILPTKAAFLHSKYMAAYSSESHPQEIKDMVDKYRNCEDIAMAFLISNSTKYLPEKLSNPIFVEGKVWDAGVLSGISTNPKSKHYSTRSFCVNELIRIYDVNGWGFPLSELKLSDRVWLRHFPGYWWQTRPSSTFEWFATDVFSAIYDSIFVS